jgi:dihydropteroate synthase-like protein
MSHVPMLIVTGNMAYDIVKEYIQPYKSDAVAIKLPISIAAFITPDLVINHLKKMDLSNYSSIIVPGLMQGSAQRIENALNIPTFKGPRYASDLPQIFEQPIELSKTLPADKLYLTKGIEEYDKILNELLASTPVHPFYQIGSLRIGIDYPPLILAEIVDAPKLSISKIISQSRYFLKNGAHMLDIGAVVGQNNAKSIGAIIEELKSTFPVPISIDSMHPEEIEVAVEAGADVILSLDAGNMGELKNLPKDRIVTIIPTNTSEGIFPKKPKERVKLLQENVNQAKGYGFKKILVDPLLESPISPGLINSLETFILFRQIDALTPFLFGAGNVSELIDADSIGINALLACIATEVGISVILTTEYSNKTRKTIEELSQALKMAFLARTKQRPPVGLPFHLLRAKSKKKYDQVIYEKPNQVILVAEPDESYSSDPLGYFKIWITHEEELISVLHYRNEEPNILIQGISAEAIGKKILTLNLIRDPNHLLYLGRELERAEISLFLGKNYVQDIKFEEVA